jgi:hypothetical protein
MQIGDDAENIPKEIFDAPTQRGAPATSKSVQKRN